MITIYEPKMEKTENQCKLSAKITYNDGEKTIWYRTAEEIGQYFDIGRADAFLVAVLPLAVLKGEDIQCQVPVSAQLLHSLRQFQIPFMCGLAKQNRLPRIIAQPDMHPLPSAGHIGTGISCGVDCLSTVIQHGLLEEIEPYRIDTMCLFNTGYYGSDGGTASQAFRGFITMSEKFCKDFGYKLISVDSNVFELPVSFGMAVSFFTTSVVLALQKYFSVYYFASAVTVFDFHPISSESESYDVLTMEHISTENLHFFLGCALFSRIEKVQLLTDHPQVFRYVYPCVDGNPPVNCGVCEKCRRTIMELDAIGKLDMASVAFDTTYYSKHRRLLWAYMLVHKNRRIDPARAPFYIEIYNEFKKRHVKAPFGARLLVPYQYYRAKLRKPLRKKGRAVLNWLTARKPGKDT